MLDGNKIRTEARKKRDGNTAISRLGLKDLRFVNILDRLKAMLHKKGKNCLEWINSTLVTTLW